MRNAAHLGIEHLVGVAANVCFLLALPDKRGLVAPPRDEMPVDTVKGGIKFAACKPLVFMVYLICFQHFVPAFEPMDQLRCSRTPKVVGVFQCAAAESVIFFWPTYPCRSFAVLRWKIAAVLI